MCELGYGDERMLENDLAAPEDAVFLSSTLPAHDLSTEISSLDKDRDQIAVLPVVVLKNFAVKGSKKVTRVEALSALRSLLELTSGSLFLSPSGRALEHHCRVECLVGREPGQSRSGRREAKSLRSDFYLSPSLLLPQIAQVVVIGDNTSASKPLAKGLFLTSGRSMSSLC